MGLTTKQKAEQSGWKVEKRKDGTEIKIIMEPAGYNPEPSKKKPEEIKIEMGTVRKTTTETTQVPIDRTSGDSEQIPTDYWIGRTHSKKDLIIVLKGISVDEQGKPIDRVFLANPRDVRDVINGDWSGARLRELVRRK